MPPVTEFGSSISLSQPTRKTITPPAPLSRAWAVFFISGKCTNEQMNKIDCRARAYYAAKSWNEFVPERIEICYPAVCPCRTAQKYCGADAEHKARVGESAGIYRASDFFEEFHIKTPFCLRSPFLFRLYRFQFSIPKIFSQATF